MSELTQYAALEASAFTGWAIDRDRINGDCECITPRVGYGQRRDEALRSSARTVAIAVELKASDVIDPVRFRTLDDDGEIYYEGAISRAWADGPDEDLTFAPLAFAMADAGATELQFRDERGTWQTI